MSRNRKFAYAAILFVVLLGVIAVPVFLSLRSMFVNGKVEGSVDGTAPVSFSPATANLEMGTAQVVTLKANIGNNTVDGFQVFIDISGHVPSDIAFAGADLSGQGLQQIAADIIDGVGGAKTLRVLYVTSNPTSSFQSVSDVVLGTLSFTAPAAGQMTLTTNAALTKILDNVSGVDIAQVPAPGTFYFHTARAHLQKARLDYDRDGKSDFALYRTKETAQYIFQSQSGFRKITFGSLTDIPVFGGDYNGDGIIDEAVFRPSEAKWIIFESGKGVRQVVFGAPTDTPVNAGDFDGDGKTDITVYRASTQTRYILRSQLGFKAITFGQIGDIPVHGADYDGDKIADVAIYRPINQKWYIFRSQLGYLEFSVAGKSGVPINGGDFDGDGKTDIALYNADLATRYIWQSELGYKEIRYGAITDIPIHGEDFDGDGKTDIAVYRPTKGLWIIFQSNQGHREVVFGGPDDQPMN